MKNKPVVIRISKEARKRLKQSAISNNYQSLISFMEDFSRQRFDKKIRNGVTV